jgi:RNA polymerase sigma-70 factor (ECF subfamily)
MDAANARRFVETFTPIVAAQVARFRLPHDLSQDAVQETLLRALRGLPRFRGDSRLTTWIFTIAFRESVRVREKWHDLDAVGGQPPGWEPEDARAAEHASKTASDAEDLVRLRKAMQRLPDDQRLVLGYHYLEGLSVSEIAELMQSTPNTVKSWLKRGRDALRLLLGVTDADPEESAARA